MSDNWLPNTNETQVALAAIAWRIVNEAAPGALEDRLHGEERRNYYTNEFIKVFSALNNLREIPTENE
ncbi:hypothetical protein G4Y79_15240 [Phototrophicus methaneseepsis]|uniref:Uncharacterized protein n=1 Tax=Phototrophicus methaneseepsis TaxID=2710758 RepID=A0A7S8ID04_9CHLR|nr:hypothetical protein [Phototrophicus methaneseepsis]QPC81057.1 hypothetical protein G4Y79_15240 [Phototrophicus methaneseepsis]